MNTKTLNISLPDELIKRTDRQAKKQNANRSELIREALRTYLTKQERWDTICALGRQHAKKLGIKESDVLRLVEEERRSKRQK